MKNVQIKPHSNSAKMTKSHYREQVGDVKSPALRPEESALRAAVDQAALIQADMSEPAAKINGLAGLACAVSRYSGIPPTTCKQIIWFSFFFDGTGNNLEADEGMSKLSNVAKLFRVHEEFDKDKAMYPIYIPGVGTYFAAIGDDGGSDLGLGCGAKGQARLDHALGEFDRFLRRHLGLANAPSNAIAEINIAVFGFSRGAALARAFITQLLQKRCTLCAGKWTLNHGAWPVRIRFMGLFDTVASVGLPMSSNTTSVVGAVASSVSYMIRVRLRDYLHTRPEVLAFSENAVPGADPAPGDYDGHTDWGGQLEINEAVEEVRHFVAAHEIRNSFPLDSISVLRRGRITKAEHFHEAVYPGAHSDVGGSYCPGEGARGSEPQENLGLIPLMHMYKYATLRGVPLLPECAWKPLHKGDFKVDLKLLRAYDYYQRKIGTSSSLGKIISKNLELFFAWRFRAVRLKEKGYRVESQRIVAQNENFRRKAAALDAEIAELKKSEAVAAAELNAAVALRQVGKIQDARRAHLVARDELLKAKARKNSLPNMNDLQEMLEMYDRQLLADVRSIRDVPKRGLFGDDRGAGKRRELRPHYKILVEAYENEFEKNKGLTDETIIDFFDNYVHDSLAGFAKDATIPSDPRVVYLGGNEKYRYAQLDGEGRTEGLEIGFG
jgi:hypothetical protein